jgi:two-component system response regulator MtrA
MSKPFALIIEDDPKLGFILDIALKQMGFDTRLDTRGDQYQSILMNITPALVILDLHLPYSSGKDIYKSLKANPSLRETLVVITTADIILAKKLEKDADMVLTKPVSVVRLRNIIEERWPGGLVPSEP